MITMYLVLFFFGCFWSSSLILESSNCHHKEEKGKSDNTLNCIINSFDSLRCYTANICRPPPCSNPMFGYIALYDWHRIRGYLCILLNQGGTMHFYNNSNKK